MIEIADAVDAFVGSYCLTKSATYPFTSSKHGDLIVTRDDPPREKRGRNMEIIVMPGAAPRDVLDQIAQMQLYNSYFISAFCAADADIKACAAQYKALGYRLLRTEPLMVFDLSKPILTKTIHAINRVTTKHDAELVKKLTRSRVLSSDLDEGLNGIVRVYYCSIGSKAVAWCKSIVTHPFASLCWEHVHIARVQTSRYWDEPSIRNGDRRCAIRAQIQRLTRQPRRGVAL